ncbi:MAG: molecular chaperone TorD family protein [Bryobacterales bacterium]|nr:molecular chaperone TorD family protein [Bryobacterales bacterium]
MTAARYLFAGNALLTTNPQELKAAAEQTYPSDPRWPEALEVDALDLEREYVRLFLSPGGAVCPPWQSVYCKDQESPMLMGDSHSSALAFYREYGMAPVHGNEPADHAGLLLLFAGMLAENGVAEDEMERFRIRHLAWLDGFAAQLEAETRLAFYRLLAAEFRAAAGECSEHGSQHEGDRARAVGLGGDVAE